jgi:hypothetical protein
MLALQNSLNKFLPNSYVFKNICPESPTSPFFKPEIYLPPDYISELTQLLNQSTSGPMNPAYAQSWYKSCIYPVYGINPAYALSMV